VLRLLARSSSGRAKSLDGLLRPWVNVPVPHSDVAGDPPAFDAVFLARHGETEWNLLRRRQGRLDSPLTGAGVAQARRHAESLADQGIDRVFASPAGRALTTARIIAATLGLPVETVDELAELDHGGFSGLIDEEIDARYPGERQRRTTDKYGWRFPDGESYADADTRAAKALDRIARHPTRRPLLVSHEMIGRMLLRRLLALDPEDAVHRPHPHDVVYRVDPAGRSCTRV